MRAHRDGLTLLLVAGSVITLAACSSGSSQTAGPGSTAANSPATNGALSTVPATGPVPAGYQRIGSAASGISIGVPATWTAVDLAALSASAADSKFSMAGASAATIDQSLQSMQNLHGVFAADVASASGPEHFARNINAYCESSGLTVEGSIGVGALSVEVKNGLASIAKNIKQQDLTVGGVPGLETTYQTSSSDGTLNGAQLEVLPAVDKVCYVTLTTSASESAGAYLATAAATATFP